MLGRASNPVESIQARQLLRGKVSDRPWGVTLGALALAGHTGQLTMTTPDRKIYRIVLSGGVIVDASSPVSVDSIARIALTAKLLPAPLAAEINKRVARMPDRDEASIVAEIGKLSRDEIEQLQRRAVLQRAARTFSIDGATFKFDRQSSVFTGTATQIDVRAVVYRGAQQHLSEQRMFEELRTLGTRFLMNPEARSMLERFELTEAEAPILAALERGTTLAELEAQHRELDPRTARAVFYALASCDAISPTKDVAPVAVVESRTRTESFQDDQATRIGTRSLAKPEISTMIADRCWLIDSGRDLFAVLGLEYGAEIEAVRSAYLELVRYIHPDRLAELGIPETMDSRRLYAAAGVAYSTLSDADSRGRYVATGPRASEQALDPEVRAQESYVRALRQLDADRPGAAVTELAKACDLAPKNVDYRATLAWATFCAAPNKQHVETITVRYLERALYKVEHPETVRLYLGRVERMLGHDPQALQHFREVLALVPDHAEAAAEIRVIEARIARGTRQRIR